MFRFIYTAREPAQEQNRRLALAFQSVAQVGRHIVAGCQVTHTEALVAVNLDSRAIDFSPAPPVMPGL